MFERPFSARYLTDTDKITFAQKRRKIQVQILMDAATKSKKDFYKVGIGGEQG